MAWNEPSGGQDPKDPSNDPWGNRGGRKNSDGPPDLDEIVRKLQQRLSGLFGRKPPVGTGGSDGNPLMWIGLGVLLVLWLVFTMFYQIDQQQRGVVLRFGEYQTTLQPGLSVRLPWPFERVIKVNTGQINTVTHEASMLTRDENIISVEAAVQWRVDDPTNYLFEVAHPAATLHQVVESAIREVVGRNTLDFVLTEGRSEIEAKQRERMQGVLDEYNAGIRITSVDLQKVKPPEAVKEAFDDAIKAREDEQRLINEAQAYRSGIIPRARGQAARMHEEAEAYKARVIARAEGEANRFELLLGEYEQAPQVTRQRLYLDTMEYILDRNSKVLMDIEGSSNLTLLPIDKLLQQSAGKQEQNDSSDSNGLSPTVQTLPVMPTTQSDEDSSTRYNSERNRGAR